MRFAFWCADWLGGVIIRFFQRVELLIFDEHSLFIDTVKISLRKFHRNLPPGTILNGLVNKTSGRYVYLLKEYRPGKFAFRSSKREPCKIVLGDCHSPEYSSLLMFVFRSRFEEWSQRVSEIVLENADLSCMPWLYGQHFGHIALTKVLDSIVSSSAPVPPAPAPSPAPSDPVASGKVE